jgi:hypothetical protein
MVSIARRWPASCRRSRRGNLINRPYRADADGDRPTPPGGARLAGARALGSVDATIVGARATSGQTVLSGADGQPLLVLDRAGRGRVAQLWSDQPWLWARGYDGGGPHGELLRRLAHWLMQEPELEDESLTLDAGPRGLEIERSTLGAAPGAVEIIAPSGQRSSAELGESAPGLWRGEAPATEQGLYEARSGNLRAFAAVGPLNPREAAALAANPEILRAVRRRNGRRCDAHRRRRYALARGAPHRAWRTRARRRLDRRRAQRRLCRARCDGRAAWAWLVVGADWRGFVDAGLATRKCLRHTRNFHRSRVLNHRKAPLRKANANIGCQHFS